MTGFTLPKSRAEAIALDRADPLGAARAMFHVPDGTIYLVGHSLGPASAASLERVRAAAATEWANGLVGSWNAAGWIDLASRVGARIARLIGAKADEVLVCDSVSVNLFKLAAAALPLARTRSILVGADEFPTDQYVAEGLAGLTGADFTRFSADEVAASLASGGVLIRSAASYRTGEIADMAGFEMRARENGTVIIWDLSHATGIVPGDLNGAGARLAAGCTYKYLNGGPGAPAFVHVARDLADRLQTPLPGWLGHARPFAFEPGYEPAPGIARFAAGTPGILSLAALDGALDALEGISVASLAEKSRRLGDVCLAGADRIGLEAVVPADRSRRGGHVSFRHASGYPLVRALAARGVLADFREPDTIRFGLSPLFLSFADIWEAMDALAGVLANGEHERPEFKVRQKVT